MQTVICGMIQTSTAVHTAVVDVLYQWLLCQQKLENFFLCSHI